MACDRKKGMQEMFAYLNMKAMREMADPERRNDAKVEYICARHEMMKAKTKAEIERIAIQTKQKIRALYKGSDLRQHDYQLLAEAIDHLSLMRIYHLLKN